ncbi:DUF2809 domain-containing protein [Actinoplanes sp. NPDC049668]|uniref:ribosomal maturation YjgA family protein n=1 Tax=unclassified Actinoplanes TaxID=2626549 RepID=UPI0033B090BE
MADGSWRVRLVAVLAAGGLLALALGIRVAAGGGVLDSSGALAQYSGTVLYASMIYAGVFLLVPAAGPWTAAATAVAFCWLVELSQLTGVPAALSEHSVLARLALGVRFDAADLAWYPVGVLPLAALHAIALRRSR